MASLNRVQIIGNLGRDPESRYTTSGDPVVSFSIAATEKWNKDGQAQERTEWFNVTCFGKRATVARDYLAKGRQVYVEGKLQTDDWTDKDGNKRKTTKVIASNIILLGSRGDKAPAGETATQEQPPEFQVSDDDVPFVAYIPFLLGLVGLVVA